MASPNSRLIPIYEGMPTPSWPAKDPANTRVFSIEMSRVLNGQAIQSATAQASPPVLPGLCTVSGTIISVVLTGGADGQTALVLITATLADGETDTRAILLPIVAQGILEVDTVATSPTTTNDATPVLIAAFPVIGFGVAVDLEGTVLARNVATGEACSFGVAAVVQNVGTPSASAGNPSVTAFAAPASLSGCGLSVQVVGNVVTIWATGLAGTQIAWTPSLRTTIG